MSLSILARYNPLSTASELSHLNTTQIAIAGATAAAALLILGATGLMSFYRFIPLPVVHGYIQYNQDFVTSKSTTPGSWLGLDGPILAISALLFLILTNGFGGDNHTIDDNDTNSLWVLSAIPSALIVFLFGLVLCFICDPSIINDLKFDWKIGFLRGAILQIPLSILNSVIAVCKLSTYLFPDHELSTTKVSVSFGVMNLVGCWFGAMPVCHEAGGLAGQCRCGGRSGASAILNQFPMGILGVLLLFVGIELAMASKDMNTKEQSFVMLCYIGFGCGIWVHLLLKLRSIERSCFGFSRCSSKSSADEESALIPSY
ncbi:hypothetical protein P3X46_020734 [Hevea brasiliensis]|uniref:Uncharacterized protein n=1 Tax=Hevea brasiliensis TaxID=3981 RepID=A0ABQ9LGU0_HEVBR|nr:hypothetical protein P3X46_020734 [Hevea brasiliensis]